MVKTTKLSPEQQYGKDVNDYVRAHVRFCLDWKPGDPEVMTDPPRPGTPPPPDPPNKRRRKKKAPPELPF